VACSLHKTSAGWGLCGHRYRLRLAHAIQDASDGHPGTALLRLALLAAVIVVLGWLWVRSLSRALVTADTTTQSSRVHGAALPLTAVSFGLAAVAGRPGYGFLGTAVGLAGLGAALALSNIFTVFLPYPMDKRAGNPMRQATQGYASHQFLGIMGNLGGVAIAVIPVIIAVQLTSADRAAIRMPVLVLCAAAYGFALAWAGVLIAAQAAEQRLPELSQIAIRSKL
jgi:hypothetical protein